jgi:amino acid transporter
MDHSETTALGEVTSRPLLLPRTRRLNFFALVGVMFFIVCGGAYGLEPLVGAVGPGWAVVLVIATPVLWSLPIALMVAELSSAMPREGGYYVWVRTALGNFWAVQEGWWTCCYMVVDLAIYPVLFVNYLAFFVPALRLDENGATSFNAWLLRWLIAVGVIAASLTINWRGAKAVGNSSLLNLAIVIVPFVLLILFAFLRSGAAGSAASIISTDLRSNHSAKLLALGLGTVLWNYMGWDNTSTFAGEVNEPQRNYPRGIIVALPLTIAAYLLPTLAGISVTTDKDLWSESQGWPQIAQLIGGRWLGITLAVAALFSAWSLFNGQLLYVSRLPFAMAIDRWLPSPLARVSKTTGVPRVSLLISCAVAAAFAALSFGKLVVIDVLLYSAALSLEFAALIMLRWKRPGFPRPFRIPGGWVAIALVTIAPMLCAGLLVIVSLSGEDADPKQALIVIVVIISGIGLYFARRKHVQSGRNPTVSEGAG